MQFFYTRHSDDDDNDDDEHNEKGKYYLNLLSKYFQRFEPFLSLVEYKKNAFSLTTDIINNAQQIQNNFYHESNVLKPNIKHINSFNL